MRITFKKPILIDKLIKILKQEQKILLFDNESAPGEGYFFGKTFETTIIEVKRPEFLYSIAYKWLGENKIHCLSLPDFSGYKRNPYSDYKLVKAFYKIARDANVLVAHNGDRFDITLLNTRLAFYGLDPLPNIKTVDTLKTLRSKFHLHSNRLDDACAFFGIGRKLPHTGKNMWLGCLLQNPKDWTMMVKYNKHDVWLLEQLYLKIRPFISNHPNMAIMKGERSVCPKCQSTNLQKRGFYLGLQIWFCNDCRSWHRSLITKNGKVSQIR